MLSFIACTDDDDFSISSSSRLTFSIDTLRVDTCFSGVPTPTKTFWVYNNSGKNLRMSSVRLANGNQSGFRVNVDGSYLSSQQGFRVNDVEIRDNDSIRVFVELTSPLNHKDTPQLVSDELVFLHESGVEQSVPLRGCSWDALMYDTITIIRDSTIQSDRPIVVKGRIRVAEGATLTISAGTTLYMHAGAYIDIFGSLNIAGEVGNKVTIRGDRLDNMFDYLKYDEISGQWGGIRFSGTSRGNRISNADIHSPVIGIDIHLAEDSVSMVDLDLENTIIHNCKGYGISSRNALISIVNCQISNCLFECVDINGGKTEILYSTIAQFYPFTASKGCALRFGNDISEYSSLLLANSIVTGYSDDEIMIENEYGSSKVCDFYLTNSIICTPPAEGENIVDIIFEKPQDEIAQDKHFVLVDIDKQKYDFHLTPSSTAIGKALPIEGILYDLDGNKRSQEKPSIGCYEPLETAN